MTHRPADSAGKLVNARTRRRKNIRIFKAVP